MFWIKKEIVYIDTLHEWRKSKAHDFNMLDRVWIVRTIQQSEYEHPHNRWKNKREFTPIEGVIIGTCTSTIYSEQKPGNEVDYEGWTCNIKDGETIEETTDGNIVYRYKKWYRVLLKNGETIDAHTIKKSHWEFQEEFEHLEAVEKKKIELLESQERYRKSLEDMEKVLEDGKKIQIKMTDRLITATLPTKK